MNKEVTVNVRNCNRRQYIPFLIELVRTGTVVPSAVISQVENIEDAIDLWPFDKRESGG